MSETFITVSSGKILHPSAWAKFLWSVKDGTYTCKLERKNKRSQSQNRYYFGCVLPIVLEAIRVAGYDEVKDVNDAHEICKMRFLTRRTVNKETGEVLEFIGSTTKLSKLEFLEYTDRIAQWLSEFFGVVIPAPGSQSAIEY